MRKKMLLYISLALAFSGCQMREDTMRQTWSERDICRDSAGQIIIGKRGYAIAETSTNMPGYTSVMRFLDVKEQPMAIPGWGHMIRRKSGEPGHPEKVELLGTDGEPQANPHHEGLCFADADECRDHCTRAECLPLRMTVEPVLTYVAHVAKIETQGGLQVPYARNGNYALLEKTSTGWVVKEYNSQKCVVRTLVLEKVGKR